MSRPAGSLELEQARVESRQRKGKVLVIAGWIFALVGVVLYCVGTFAADPEADLAAIVLTGAVPSARAALVIIACGTVIWIAGSIMHLGAALDAAEPPATTTPNPAKGKLTVQ
jgi:hypothetical protein